MSQVDDFRKVLGLPDPDAKDEEIAEEFTQREMKEEKKNSAKTKKAVAYKTISLDIPVYKRLKLLTYWTFSHGRTRRPSFKELMIELINVYSDKYPDAKWFLDANA